LLLIITAIMLTKSRMEGFIIFDYEKEYPRALKDLGQWLSAGKIKRKDTIMKGGLEKAEQALRDLYDGVNTGMSHAV
jgi:NADPH-dependent curcumin reductase CurA